MRISLIHGEDTIKAYEKYQKLIEQSKSKGFDIISISDIHNIVSQSLFEDKVVFTLDRPKKVPLNDWKWFGKNASKYNSNLLIYFDGNAPITITKNLPKDIKKEKFELPFIIFKFLESFWPGNSKASLKLLKDLTQNQPVELALAMLSRHLRDLYWAKASPDTLNMPPWRLSKLKSQLAKFEEKRQRLEEIINKLAEIDIKSKTSDANLKDMLDILIIKNLK